MTTQNQIIRNCVADLSKYYGLPPYDNHPLFQDPVIRMKVHDSYTDAVISHAYKRVNELMIEWDQIRSKFLGVHKLK